MSRRAQYRVIRRLGRGGMSEVFLADSSRDRCVALKRLDATLARDPDAVTLFLDEARTASRLDHDNIARVLDYGRDDDGYFLAMEYLEGVDARRLVRMCPTGIKLEAAVAIATGIASGLHHAHEQVDANGTPLHIVHRDVTAGNVVVTVDGAVKLIDFGIARAADRTTRTSSGRVRGTVAYMAPEQVQGLALDRRSDLFSLGVVLYELVTGRRPFDRPGDPDLVVMRRIEIGVHDPPSMRRPECGLELEDVIERLLAIDPALRYADGASLVHDLIELAGARPWSANRLGSFVRGLCPAALQTRSTIASLPPSPPAPAPPVIAAVPDPRRTSRIPLPRSRRSRPVWLLAAGAVATTGSAVAVAFGVAAAPRPTASATRCVADAEIMIESAKFQLAGTDHPRHARNSLVHARTLLGGYPELMFSRPIHERCGDLTRVPQAAAMTAAADGVETTLRARERIARLVFVGLDPYSRVLYQDLASGKLLGDDDVEQR